MSSKTPARGLAGAATPGPRRKRERGQVMPMTAVFIVTVILALWVLYDSGQVMSDKIRLQNTADNVAYSTATLVARDLNFIAYTNRGMVANQIGIAQMVGLSSWAASIEQLAINADTIANAFPPARAFTGPSRGAATSASDAMDEFARRMIQLNELVITGLSEAQFYFHQGLVAQVASFGQDIARGNDPDARALLSVEGISFADSASLIAEWNEQIGEQYQLHSTREDSDDARLHNSRYQDFDRVVRDSRDRFTRNRSYSWPFPFTGTNGPTRWRTRKYGASEFFLTVDPDDDRYRWEWAGMETVSAYYEVYIPTEGWERAAPELPMAWGAAHALHESRDPNPFHDYGVTRERRSRSLWGNGAWRNRAAATALLASPATSSSIGGKDHVNHHLTSTQGLRPFHEFLGEEPLDSGPAVIAIYVKDERDLNSQSRIIEGEGGTVVPDLDTDLAGGLLAGRIGAAAKAQPYFARPTDLAAWRRGDRHVEYGNLYNPYWQPRLVDLTDAEKLSASAIVTGGRIGGSGS